MKIYTTFSELWCVQVLFLKDSKVHYSETKKGGTLIFVSDLKYISIKYYEAILKIVNGRTGGQTGSVMPYYVRFSKTDLDFLK